MSNLAIADLERGSVIRFAGALGADPTSLPRVYVVTSIRLTRRGFGNAEVLLAECALVNPKRNTEYFEVESYSLGAYGFTDEDIERLERARCTVILLPGRVLELPEHIK